MLFTNSTKEEFENVTTSSDTINIGTATTNDQLERLDNDTKLQLSASKQDSDVAVKTKTTMISDATVTFAEQAPIVPQLSSRQNTSPVLVARPAPTPTFSTLSYTSSALHAAPSPIAPFLLHSAPPLPGVPPSVLTLPGTPPLPGLSPGPVPLPGLPPLPGKPPSALTFPEPAPPPCPRLPPLLFSMRVPPSIWSNEKEKGKKKKKKKKKNQNYDYDFKNFVRVVTYGESLDYKYEPFVLSTKANEFETQTIDVGIDEEKQKHERLANLSLFSDITNCPGSTKHQIDHDDDDDDQHSCRHECYYFSKQIFYRVCKYKGIYFTAIIHFSDVITDILILCQYILFAIDENFYSCNYDNIDYFWVAVCSFLILILNRILGCLLIWTFTQSWFDTFLNFFDFYLFKEIFASHNSGNKTDLMQFLQKIEKIFESSPEFILQTFVLLRSDASYTNIQAILTQLISISLSVYAISNKLISDDSKAFIESSGANTSWKPHKLFVFRVLYRICEVTSNLFLFVIIGVFFGAFWLFLYFFWLLSINWILYTNGLLGESAVNIVAYSISIMNLGLVPRHTDEHRVQNYNYRDSGKSIDLITAPQDSDNVSHSSVMRNDSNVVDMMMTETDDNNGIKNWRRKCGCLLQCMINIWYLKCKFNNHKRARYLSYYYTISRIIQSLIILTITIIMFYATRNENWTCVICTQSTSRNENHISMTICLFLTVACILCQYVFFQLFFNALHLGTSLNRDTGSLISKYQFFDGIRLERIKTRNKTDKLQSYLEIYDKILNNIIIDKNIPLIYFTDTVKNDSIRSETVKEYQYFINQINDIIDEFNRACNPVDSSSDLESQQSISSDLDQKHDNTEDSEDSKDDGESDAEEITRRTHESKHAMEQLLVKTLTRAVLSGHATMIGFILCNKFISNIDKHVFGYNNQNIISFILEYCDHRMNDIIEPLILQYSQYIDNFEIILQEKENTFRKNNSKTNVMQRFFANNREFGNIMTYLTKYHPNALIKCQIISYICENNFDIPPKYVYFPDITDIDKDEIETIINDQTAKNRIIASLCRYLPPISKLSKRLRRRLLLNDPLIYMTTILNFLDSYKITLCDFLAAVETMEKQRKLFSNVILFDVFNETIKSRNFSLFVKVVKMLPLTEDNFNNKLIDTYDGCAISLIGLLVREISKIKKQDRVKWIKHLCDLFPNNSIDWQEIGIEDLLERKYTDVCVLLLEHSIAVEQHTTDINLDDQVSLSNGRKKTINVLARSINAPLILTPTVTPNGNSYPIPFEEYCKRCMGGLLEVLEAFDVAITQFLNESISIDSKSDCNFNQFVVIMLLSVARKLTFDFARFARLLPVTDSNVNDIFKYVAYVEMTNDYNFTNAKYLLDMFPNTIDCNITALDDPIEPIINRVFSRGSTQLIKLLLTNIIDFHTNFDEYKRSVNRTVRVDLNAKIEAHDSNNGNKQNNNTTLMQIARDQLKDRNSLVRGNVTEFLETYQQIVDGNIDDIPDKVLKKHFPNLSNKINRKSDAIEEKLERKVSFTYSHFDDSERLFNEQFESIQANAICATVESMIKRELIDSILIHDNPVLFDIILESWNEYCSKLGKGYGYINPFYIYSSSDVVFSASNANKKLYNENRTLFDILHGKITNDRKLGATNERRIALLFGIFEKWSSIMIEHKNCNKIKEKQKNDLKQDDNGSDHDENKCNLNSVTYKQYINSYKNTFRLNAKKLKKANDSFFYKMCTTRLIFDKYTYEDVESQSRYLKICNNICFGKQGLIISILKHFTDKSVEIECLAYIWRVLQTWYGKLVLTFSNNFTSHNINKENAKFVNISTSSSDDHDYTPAFSCVFLQILSQFKINCNVTKYFKERVVAYENDKQILIMQQQLLEEVKMKMKQHENNWGPKKHAISVNEVEFDLLNLHQRYFVSVDKYCKMHHGYDSDINNSKDNTNGRDSSETNVLISIKIENHLENDQDLSQDELKANESKNKDDTNHAKIIKYKSIKKMEKFLFDIICNKKYFCNKNYKYFIKSPCVGAIISDHSGIYLFHAILRNDSMSNTLMKIFNTTKDESKLLLLLDNSQTIPLQCIVFGSYNEKYQKIKLVKNNYQDYQNSELIQLLHKIQKRTIEIKLKSIC